MPARTRPTFSTYSARDIDDDQAEVGTPGQHATGSVASRTSANRAQVTRPSKVTTTAHQPAVSSAVRSSVTSTSRVASRPPNHASGAGPSVERTDRRARRRKLGPEVQRLRGGQDLDGEHRPDVGHHLAQLPHGGPPHRDVVL